MEADAYEHEQELIFYTKAKAILDDWVRYEAKIRDQEQRRVVDEVISSVMAAVKDPKFQDKYMDQCVSDIEAAFASWSMILRFPR